ncbi:unnamed protein product [Protopolystoma xenopodis]|uniref:Uncharacterized protein n=1 Tax=Protopolystoma xenopodis TaxID=117903 RepID=A0A3S5B367_9PLAT|nr:unnamed protein product [Protopolystoma xenopodis]
MLPRSDDFRHMTDESLARFYWNRSRLHRKQRQHECSSKANRQLVKRNPPSSSGGTDHRISSPNTSIRNGNFLKLQNMADSLVDRMDKIHRWRDDNKLRNLGINISSMNHRNNREASPLPRWEDLASPPYESEDRLRLLRTPHRTNQRSSPVSSSIATLHPTSNSAISLGSFIPANHSVSNSDAASLAKGSPLNSSRDITNHTSASFCNVPIIPGLGTDHVAINFTSSDVLQPAPHTTASPDLVASGQSTGHVT